ncbi:hypothetical protein LNP25_26710 [Klebsiella variicola subsp. variicola]|nr:hypothetical protein [Klebsiella variicola subsp. variicola]
MHSVFNGRDLPVIRLDYHVLPYYTLRTTMRLVIRAFANAIFNCLRGSGSKICTDEESYFALSNFMESVPLVGFPDFHYRLFLDFTHMMLWGLRVSDICHVYRASLEYDVDAVPDAKSGA